MRSLSRPSCGERNECGSASALCALNDDVAAVRFDDAFHDRQAQPRAGWSAGALSVHMTIEHVWQEVGRYTEACVRHGRNDLSLASRGSDLDATSRRRELHGVFS